MTTIHIEKDESTGQFCASFPREARNVNAPAPTAAKALAMLLGNQLTSRFDVETSEDQNTGEFKVCFRTVPGLRETGPTLEDAVLSLLRQYGQRLGVLLVETSRRAIAGDDDRARNTYTDEIARIHKATEELNLALAAAALDGLTTVVSTTAQTGPNGAPLTTVAVRIQRVLDLG